MKISSQVTLSYFLIVGLASVFFLSVFIRDIKPGVTQSVEETLVDTANILAELAGPDLTAGRLGDGAFARAVEAYTQRSIDAPISGLHKTSLDYRIIITDRQGIVVFDSAHELVGADYSRWNDVYLSLKGKYGARSTTTEPSNRNSAVMHVAAPVLDHGEIVGVLTVAKADSTIAPFIDRAESTVRAQGIVLLLAAALIGVFFSFRLTRSIERLRRYAKAVSAGSKVGLPPTLNREIAELGEALEGMRDKLDGRLYVEEYVHALTHELKSPVAAILAAAELLQDEVPAPERKRFVNNIREQADRIHSIALRLLELARVEQLHTLESRVPVALDAQVEKLQAELAARLEARALKVRISGSVEPIQGDPFLITQALRNLLENALDFAPVGSTIEVGLSQSERYAEIRIEDAGPGVPDFAVSRIFERFYSLARPDGAAKSTGLGLPLVQEVAKLHGGSVSLENRPAGGAVACLRLSRR